MEILQKTTSLTRQNIHKKESHFIAQFGDCEIYSDKRYVPISEAECLRFVDGSSWSVTAGIYNRNPANSYIQCIYKDPAGGYYKVEVVGKFPFNSLLKVAEERVENFSPAQKN